MDDRKDPNWYIYLKEDYMFLMEHTWNEED